MFEYMLFVKFAKNAVVWLQNIQKINFIKYTKHFFLNISWW